MLYAPAELEQPRHPPGLAHTPSTQSSAQSALQISDGSVSHVVQFLAKKNSSVTEGDFIQVDVLDHCAIRVVDTSVSHDDKLWSTIDGRTVRSLQFLAEHKVCRKQILDT